MSIASLSFTLVNLSVPQAPARPVGAVGNPPPVSPGKACGSDTPRPNRLVEAMLAALRELGIGGARPAAPEQPAQAADASQAAAAHDATEVARATDAAGSSAGDVESAVHRFAHELMAALRHGGRRETSHEDSERGADRPHGHRHHHAWRHEGYGGLSQRLETLARTIGASPAAEATAAPAVVPGNALLDAFSGLFGAVQPQPAPGPAASDLSAKLRRFLQTLAQALQPADVVPSAPQQVGGLVDVTA